MSVADENFFFLGGAATMTAAQIVYSVTNPQGTYAVPGTASSAGIVL